MELEQFFQLMSTYGFSVIVAGYLVLFITKKLNSKFDRLAEAIDRLNDTILEAIHSNNEVLRQIARIEEKIEGLEKEIYARKYR